MTELEVYEQLMWMARNLGAEHPEVIVESTDRIGITLVDNVSGRTWTVKLEEL